jgi:hypothetical protein
MVAVVIAPFPIEATLVVVAALAVVASVYLLIRSWL